MSVQERPCPVHGHLNCNCEAGREQRLRINAHVPATTVDVTCMDRQCPVCRPQPDKVPSDDRVAMAIGRVKALIMGVAQPEDWRREHEAILCDHVPETLLEALKRTVAWSLIGSRMSATSCPPRVQVPPGLIARHPGPPPITATGTWRVYFHRLNPDGLPWCVAPDAGGWEIAVRSVEFEVPARAVHEPKSTPDDEDGRPSAWIAVTGTLTVGADGRATIRGSERST